jgi:cbb3-type cytochrome oxidase subunit 3
MSMSKIMSFLELSVYPSIALVFFLAAFIAVIWRVMTTTKQEINDAANIVLDDDTVVAPRGRIQTSSSSDQGVNHG